MKQMNWVRTVSVILIALAILFLAACQAETVDSARAADIHTARWQAMADFYAQNNMLTNNNDNEATRPVGRQSLAPAQDDFDYAAAADLSAARWQAMANYYVQNDMLTRFDSAKAADSHAARWIAMGRYYEKMGLLNTSSVPVAE